MAFSKFRLPYYWWLLLTGLLLSYPLIILLVAFTDNQGWLSFAVLPPVIGIIVLGQVQGNTLAIASLLFYLLGGILEEKGGMRSSLWFHLPVLMLAWILALLYEKRTSQKQVMHHEELAVLNERLIMVRQQYETDLVVNVSNQKKYQRYSKLNHVSRVMGSQLLLEKVGEKALQEARDILGVERGVYTLGFDFGDSKPRLLLSLPETQNVNDVFSDQYGAWALQQRKSLLITDVNSDFRFQALGPNTMVRSILQAPMIAEGKVFGLLRAESPHHDAFTKDDLRLFAIIADLAGVSAENARLYRCAQELAITDGLTGLFLRRFFNQRFSEELVRFQAYGAPFSLMMLDLDHFKRVNDRLGHLAGDQVLAQFGAKLRAESRVADIVCRFGGEEFALLLPNTNIEGALIKAERIRLSVSLQEFEVDGEILHMTVSIGLGECPKHSADMNELIRLTDEALYTAKSRGRNRIVIAGGGT